MKEIVYKFIKTQNKSTQHILFDALTYFYVYDRLPDGLSEKNTDILNFVLSYESLSNSPEGLVEQQFKRGAPKGNRNNKWCRMKDAESTNEYNSDTNQVQISTNEVQKEYNSDTNNTNQSTKGIQKSTNKYNSSTNEVQKSTNTSTNADTKEAEKETESVPQTPLKDKEKEEEKEENYVKEDPLKSEKPKTDISTPQQPKRAKSGSLTITAEELANPKMFQFRFPFVEDNYLPVFIKWLIYKRERRESYKSEVSLHTCYKQLVERSGGDADVGMQVVDQSIGNNWSGLFELKKNPKKMNTMVMHNLSDPHRYDGMEEMFNG